MQQLRAKTLWNISTIFNLTWFQYFSVMQCNKSKKMNKESFNHLLQLGEQLGLVKAWQQTFNAMYKLCLCACLLMFISSGGCGSVKISFWWHLQVQLYDRRIPMTKISMDCWRHRRIIESGKMRAACPNSLRTQWFNPLSPPLQCIIMINKFPPEFPTNVRNLANFICWKLNTMSVAMPSSGYLTVKRRTLSQDSSYIQWGLSLNSTIMNLFISSFQGNSEINSEINSRELKFELCLPLN